jgi:hypothetical protein
MCRRVDDCGIRNAECELKIRRKARENQRTNGETGTTQFCIINCSKKSEIRNPKSKIEADAYLNGTSQGEPVLSLSKEHPRTPGRTAMSSVAVTPWRDEISGLKQS